MTFPQLLNTVPRPAAAYLPAVRELLLHIISRRRAPYLVKKNRRTDITKDLSVAQHWFRFLSGRACHVARMLPIGMLLAGPAMAELTIVDRSNDALSTSNSIVVAADSTVDAAKQAAGKYIDESLALFRAGNYEQSIAAGRKALEISPGEAIAYNNICAAYNALAKWEQAAEACTKAVQLAPEFELAKNNLAHATQMKSVAAEDYINKSLALYEARRYAESISASQRALELRPGYAEAWNNICAANIASGSYDDGIKACAKAIELKPDYQLARNNLAWGQQMKAAANAKGGPR